MDLKVIFSTLLNYYQGVHPDWGKLSISDIVDMTSGWETELYRFRLEYEECSIQHNLNLVVRFHSGKYATRKAIREFTVLRDLRDVGYPVPEAHELEVTGRYLGKPFLVIERIFGHSMMEDFKRSPQKSLGLLITTFSRLFADLHNIDREKIYPNISYETTQEYLEAKIFTDRLEVEDQDLGWLTPVLDWLDENISGVSDMGISVLHRDFHPGNIMVKPNGSHAVIDWGASKPGDYREDILWTVTLASAFWDKSFGNAFLKGYEMASDRRVQDVGYWEVIGIFRRMLDVTISLTAGAEEASMRAGALDQMKESLEHLHEIHNFLQDRTGIRLSKFDKLLKSI